MTRPVWIGILFIASLGSVAAGLLLGSVRLPAAEVWAALAGNAAAPTHDIVWLLRLPRVASAFGCGALLATAGVLLQVLLRNPLADPYVLGVSGGSAVASLSAFLLGASWATASLAALAGAGVVTALVFVLSYRGAGWNMERLLLTGVVLSSGFAAIISLLLVIAPSGEVRGMLFWLMGDLANADQPVIPWLLLLVMLPLSIALGRHLDILLLGEVKAESLGVPVSQVQVVIYVSAAVAAAGVVATAGSIGFVGLLVPHLVRLLGIHLHRALLPCAALLGGSFLTFADMLARTVAAPTQLPVGAITALIGVPALLALLVRQP